MHAPDLTQADCVCSLFRKGVPDTSMLLDLEKGTEGFAKSAARLSPVSMIDRQTKVG